MAGNFDYPPFRVAVVVGASSEYWNGGVVKWRGSCDGGKGKSEGRHISMGYECTGGFRRELADCYLK